MIATTRWTQRGWASACVLLATSMLGVVSAAGHPPSHSTTQPGIVRDLHPSTTQAKDGLRADLNALTAEGAIGVVGAFHGPSISWAAAAGVRSIDRAQPARTNDRIRIGSVTKSMVATLALQEVQRGRWRLSTTIDDVWPGLLPGHGRVTVEELLSHRSGLPDYLPPLLAPATTPSQLVGLLSRHYTDSQLVRTALTQPWLFPPGTDFSYSNTNYVVVGMLLARTNHQQLQQLLTQRIFRPAHMTSARFPERVWPRASSLSGYALFERPYNLDRTSPSLLSAAGSVVASASDLDRFYRALFTGRLLRPDLVRSMATPRSTKTLAYGLGIYAVGDPCPSSAGTPQALYGHDGATFGTLTLAFTSADGTRQASIAWTGRQYPQTPTASQTANQFLIDAFTATCPRPVPASNRKTTARQLSQLPSTDRLDLAMPLLVH